MGGRQCGDSVGLGQGLAKFLREQGKLPGGIPGDFKTAEVNALRGWESMRGNPSAENGFPCQHNGCVPPDEALRVGSGNGRRRLLLKPEPVRRGRCLDEREHGYVVGSGGQENGEHVWRRKQRRMETEVGEISENAQGDSPNAEASGRRRAVWLQGAEKRRERLGRGGSPFRMRACPGFRGCQKRLRFPGVVEVGDGGEKRQRLFGGVAAPQGVGDLHWIGEAPGGADRRLVIGVAEADARMRPDIAACAVAHCLFVDGEERRPLSDALPLSREDELKAYCFARFNRTIGYNDALITGNT